MYREDCFANIEDDCTAVWNKDCYNCKFYRNDITREHIEQDIFNYGTDIVNKKKSKKKGKK